MISQLHNQLRLLFLYTYRLTETKDLLIWNFRDTGNTCGGAEDNVDYVRFGNIEFNAQGLKITYQAYQELRVIYSVLSIYINMLTDNILAFVFPRVKVFLRPSGTSSWGAAPLTLGKILKLILLRFFEIFS